jgi:hypothetical protein
MGHPNSKIHKGQHGGYKEKPSKKAVQANLDFWAALKPDDSEPKLEFPFDELDILFGTPGKGTPKLGTQLRLF